MDVKEAVFWLLDFAGYRKTENWKTKEIIVAKKETERKPFLLPKAAADNCYLYRYLMEERHLSKEVIDWSRKSIFDFDMYFLYFIIRSWKRI